MNADVRRYLVGLIGFAFVTCWATAGLPIAIAALALCVAIVSGPNLAARRRRRHRPRPVRARPISDVSPSAHQLVPDDPSLVIELG